MAKQERNPFERDLLDQIDAFSDQMIALRREFHRNPELGWCEYLTTDRIVHHLRSWGIKPRTGRQILKSDRRSGLPDESEMERAWRYALGKCDDKELMEEMRGGFTGAVVEIEGGKPGPTVGFRADIDALPIVESSSDNHLPHRLGFASERKGCMHACGHDGHTAIGLSMARLIHANRANWPGKALIIFQPAEEGGRGARAMAPTGVVDDCDTMLTWHLADCRGRFGHVVGGASGFSMSKKARAVFAGKASHAGARPHDGRNALLAAANATINLHAITRHSDGDTRVNVGHLQAFGSHNIVPDNAEFLFEVRSDVDEVLRFLVERAEMIVDSAAKMQGVTASIAWTEHIPSAASDENLVETIGEVCGDITGVSGFTKYFKDPGSDDATIFMRRVQERGGNATYMLIGAGLSSGLHTPSFDMDEAALPLATKILALTALRHRAAPD